MNVGQLSLSRKRSHKVLNHKTWMAFSLERNDGLAKSTRCPEQYHTILATKIINQTIIVAPVLFSKKYGPMTPLDHRQQETVSR